MAGIALLIAVMATFPYFGVARVDAEARQRQEMLVRRNIALWTGDVEFSLTAWTIWDEAIAKLDNNFDFDWTDRNIGASLIGTSRTRFVAVLDSDDAVLYSRTDDTVKTRPFFLRGAPAIVKDSAQLVADVRARTPLTAKPGIPKPIAASRIEVLGDEAVLLSASLFQPDFGTAKPKGNRAPILITAMPIAGALQNFFGDRFLLDDARISPLSTVSADRARAEIAVNPKGESQVLSWQPPRPAADILRQSLPLIMTVGVALLAGGFLLIRVSQHTAEMLVGRERQMRHAATHDFLTGLANRSVLQQEFQTLAEAGLLTVVCIDLDGFKAVNDNHGHAMGDELLKLVAARLKGATRDRDRIFRLGGDEFALLLPAIPMATAEQTCSRLSATLAEPFSLSCGTVSIGASFGISTIVDANASYEVALNAADSALYHAKSKGRGSIATTQEDRALATNRNAA